MTTQEQIEAVKAYCRERTWCVMGSPWEGEAEAQDRVKRHVLALLEPVVVTPSRTDRQPPTSATQANSSLSAVAPGTTKHPDLVTPHEESDV